mmetsp:Transcript_5645/g.14326  ORF Transcript_5645/g.14326 Transcript_5645/m.14326 type:complete len:217 (-) Transcript_5645:1216-1866(-)
MQCLVHLLAVVCLATRAHELRDGDVKTSGHEAVLGGPTRRVAQTKHVVDERDGAVAEHSTLGAPVYDELVDEVLAEELVGCEENRRKVGDRRLERQTQVGDERLAGGTLLVQQLQVDVEHLLQQRLAALRLEVSLKVVHKVLEQIEHGEAWRQLYGVRWLGVGQQDQRTQQEVEILVKRAHSRHAQPRVEHRAARTVQNVEQTHQTNALQHQIALR